MVYGIFVNMSFLVTCLCVGILTFRKSRAGRRASKRRSRLFSCLLGAFCGCTGIVLAVFAARAGTSGETVDFGCVTILLAAMEGGALSSAVCAALLIVSYALRFGFCAAAARYAGSVLLTAAASCLVARTKLPFGKKWALGTALSVPAASVGYLTLLPSGGFWRMTAVFTAGLLPVSALCCLMIGAELKADELVRKLRRESTRDYLTGLNNVRKFDAMYNIAVRSALEHRRSLSLLMCDVDFFKKVNDRYGHRNGDAVLVQLSSILLRNFPHSVVSRNGGEEFTVLLRGRTAPQALAEAERLRGDVEHSGFLLLDGSRIRVTISVGVASCHCPGADAERLLERADTALYLAKRSGRNRIAAAPSGAHQPDAQAADFSPETFETAAVLSKTSRL